MKNIKIRRIAIQDLCHRNSYFIVPKSKQRRGKNGDHRNIIFPRAYVDHPTQNFGGLDYGIDRRLYTAEAMKCE